jgi:hypothetical protein
VRRENQLKKIHLGQVAPMDEHQVATSKPSGLGSRGGGELSGNRVESVCGEEGEVEEFFGQLWWFPTTPQARFSASYPNQFWICRDIWEAGLFQGTVILFSRGIL